MSATPDARECLGAGVRRFALACAFAGLVVTLGACRPTPAAASAPSGAADHPGEVWLSPDDVKIAQIRIEPVGEHVVDDTIVNGGTVTLEDQSSAHVFSPVTGRVVKIIANLGDEVKKGDALAIIESPDVGTVVSDAHKAEAVLIAAEHDLRRKQDLFSQNASSAADVESAEDAYRNAKAELDRARQKQGLLRVGNVDSVTQTYALLSPIDGQVLVRNINPGVEVQGQYTGGTTQELFTIGEIDAMWVFADVYEAEIGRVHVGAPVRVTVVAYPDKVFEGRVDWISGSLDPNTRTARVRASFDNPDRLLRPSMYATVSIGVDERKALAIPRDALLRLGEYAVVFVQIGEADGHVRFERVPVEIVEGPGSWLEVAHGLDAGQMLVVSGASLLSQKM